MSTLHKTKSTNSHSRKSHIGDAAVHLFDEGKKYANELYTDGLDKVYDMQKNAKVYSDEMIEVVKRKPVTSLLIAAGVGFILSAMLRK